MKYVFAIILGLLACVRNYLGVHHLKASKPYNTLETHDERTVLPSGYFGMFYLAIIPPLWFKNVNLF